MMGVSLSLCPSCPNQTLLMIVFSTMMVDINNHVPNVPLPSSCKSSQTLNPFELLPRNRVQIKTCPKLVQPFLLNPKYSLDHFHMCIGIYCAINQMIKTLA